MGGGVHKRFTFMSERNQCSSAQCMHGRATHAASVLTMYHSLLTAQLALPTSRRYPIILFESSMPYFAVCRVSWWSTVKILCFFSAFQVTCVVLRNVQLHGWLQVVCTCIIKINNMSWWSIARTCSNEGMSIYLVWDTHDCPILTWSGLRLLQYSKVEWAEK